MTIRESVEAWEEKFLSPYASLSNRSKGRDREEPQCDIRPVYQRDRDRILHCKAFRRLNQKTQVFMPAKGDHYRTRLTHSLEVSQNARTIAKALHLNEDLTEAIALGHDLGHTPFGHAGERALSEAFSEIDPKGFFHHEQSVRIVELLEKEGRGLNLTWEVRDGILNHQTDSMPHTLEGQIVRLSDKIAYVNHDIDDAVRAGILQEEEIPKELYQILGRTYRERLDRMIHDIVKNSWESDHISMSEKMWEAMLAMRRFLYVHVYQSEEAKRDEERAIKIIKELYAYYQEHPEEIPEKYRKIVSLRKEPAERAICDYLSGMTDSYAQKKYREVR